MKIDIRPFAYTPSDYQSVIQVWNACWPNLQGFQDNMQQDDAGRDRRFPLTRCIAEISGQVVGYGDIRKLPQDGDEFAYYFSVQVLPGYRRQGIGSAVYEYLMDLLKTTDAQVLHSDTYDTFPDSIHFLSQRGFEEFKRYPISVLNVQQFDPGRFDGLNEKMQQMGIQIQSIAALSTSDPQWREKLWQLDSQIQQDAPGLVAPRQLTLEEFCQKKIDSYWFLPELWWIAIQDGTWVGESAVEAIDDHRYYTHITGVTANFRRRGIATALKLQIIEQARKMGAQTIQTSNEENNPMYQINLRLGFTPEPTELYFRKVLE